MAECYVDKRDRRGVRFVSGLARNSSTLKLISKNGRLCTKCCGFNGGQIPAECGFCIGTQPATIQVEFSNFVDIGPAA